MKPTDTRKQRFFRERKGMYAGKQAKQIEQIVIQSSEEKPTGDDAARMV